MNSENQNNIYNHLPVGSTALVTGATGFTGEVLVKKLVAQGVKVRAVARGTSNLEPFQGMPIEWVRAQVYDEEVISKAVKGVDYIFHVAAAYREAKITDEIYTKVHVDSTKILASAATKEGTVKRFVHVSTVGVHGHIDNPPADESYPFSPGDLYQSTKLEAELWIREYAEKSSLPLTVIRPAAIYGPKDKRLLKVFKMAAKPFFPLFGNGRGLYHLIHVEDLASAFICAAVHPDAVGQTFIAGNAKPSELREIAKIISKALGKPKMTFLRFPVWPLFLLGDICEAVCKPFGIEPPIYRRRVAFFTKDRAFNTDKIHNLLGWKESISTEEGLSQTAKWYREAGWL